jgi:hypothetical protein
MTSSLDLLDRATGKFKSTRELSKALGFAPTTLATAKGRGHLSPTVAGMLARALGEDEMYWVALAGIESDKPTEARDAMLKQAQKWRRL